MIEKRHLDKYLASRGLSRIAGDEMSVVPLMPLLVMDAENQVYCADVKPCGGTHETRRLLSRWSESYHRFNAGFFSCFSEDERDEVIEGMDEYWECVKNDVMVLKVAIMNRMRKEDLEMQKLIAGCMVCNILAQIAQIMWRKSYLNIYGRSEMNKWIDDCRYCAVKYMNRKYFRPGKEDVNFNEDTATTAAVEVLMNKTTNWLKRAVGSCESK